MSLDLQYVVSEHVDRENPSAQLVYHCDWDERLDQSANLVGGLQYDTSGNPSYVQPQEYPLGSGIFCTNIDIKPLGDYNPTPDDDGACYATAELTVSYGPLKVLNPDGDSGLDICQVTCTESAEMLPLPQGQFQWPDGTALDQDTDIKPSLIAPYTELSIKVLFSSRPMITDTNNLLGQVNSADITLTEDDTISAGTGLLLGCESEEVFNCQGQPAWLRNIKIGVRDNDGLGWNGLWNPDDQEFQQITNTDSGDPMYESGDFTGLFGIS